MKLAIWDAILRRNLPRLIELLDEAGDDVNLDAHDDRGHTALCFASECGFPEIVELLLSRGATPDAPTKPDSLNVRLNHSQTPLHIISERDGPSYLEIAKLLIRHGASIDADSIGYTPLQNAVNWDNRDMVEFLLRQGADPLVKGPEGSILFLAIKMYAQDNGALFRVIWPFIERKEIAFHLDHNGNTVLHLAVICGAMGALDILLRACVCKTGLSSSVLNSNLESPLAIAISDRNLDAARSILLFGGQPVAPPNFAADPDSSQLTLASPLLRAFKELLQGKSTLLTTRRAIATMRVQAIPFGGGGAESRTGNRDAAADAVYFDESRAQRHWRRSSQRDGRVSTPFPRLNPKV